MERKLKAIFDYQKFEKNPFLEKLVSETENRYAKELSDDDIGFVNAAGDYNPEGVYNDGVSEEASWRRD